MSECLATVVCQLFAGCTTVEVRRRPSKSFVSMNASSLSCNFLRFCFPSCAASLSSEYTWRYGSNNISQLGKVVFLCGCLQRLTLGRALILQLLPLVQPFLRVLHTYIISRMLLHSSSTMWSMWLWVDTSKHVRTYAATVCAAKLLKIWF